MANTSLHIKRIQQELKDFLQNPSDTFHAEPLKEEIHIWHFTIKGPTATEFEGGIYHGKIELPFDYPLKPPAIYFLTPSGRYETNTKICLTITDYHPEHWNPGWTIKTMLKALISYFPEKEGTTSVGALEYSPEERKKLAQLSRKWVCPICGPIIGIIKEKEEEKKEEETDNKVTKEGEQKVGASEDEVPVEEADVGQAGEIEEEVIENESDKKEKSKEDPFGDHFVRKEIDIQEKEKNRERERERERERKREERRTSSQQEDRSEVEVDLKMLESALLQHILYYEAKQSVRYQRNLLNPEKPQPETSNEEERKEASATIKSAPAEKSFEESIGATDYKVEENEELLQENSQKEAEKQRIKQQITYINVLIVVMLVGIVAVIVAV